MINVSKSTQSLLKYIWTQKLSTEVTISFNETTLTLGEGATRTVILNIDTGLVVGNITLMVTDGTTSMSKSKRIDIAHTCSVYTSLMVTLSPSSGLHTPINASSYSNRRYTIPKILL